MALRVLKTRGFERAARKDGLTDQALCQAVAEIESGLVDARLGGFLLKKRVAKAGRGKSGGFRTIVAHRKGDRLVCLFLFAKNERDNVTDKERLALSEIGDEYMTLAPAKQIGCRRRSDRGGVRWRRQRRAGSSLKSTRRPTICTRRAPSMR